jgi:hypothetical protein
MRRRQHDCEGRSSSLAGGRLLFAMYFARVRERTSRFGTIFCWTSRPIQVDHRASPDLQRMKLCYAPSASRMRVLDALSAILILTLKWVLDQWEAQRNRGMGADGDARGTPARW